MKYLEDFIKFTVVLFIGYMLSVGFPTMAQPMGETPYTFENLKRDCTTPNQLQRWLQQHVLQKDFANKNKVIQHNWRING